MAVEYEIASDIAVISEVANTNQLAHVAKFYTGAVTYDDEASSKFATVTIDGKSQRVMLCIAVNGTVNYDDVPCKYSTVDGHRCLNVVEPNGTEIVDDVPSVYETMVVDGKTVRAIRCVLINQTPIYDGVSSVCTFVDSGKTHTAQLVNVVGAGSIEVIVKGVPPLILPDAIEDGLVSLKAFGGTEQGLPAGYTALTYVENSATTLVPLGVSFGTSNFKMEITAVVQNGSLNLFQSQTSGGLTRGIGGSSSNTIYGKAGSINDVSITANNYRTAGHKYAISFTAESGTGTLKVDDLTAETTETVTGTYTTGVDSTEEICLFGNTQAQYVGAGTQIFSAKLWKDGALVLDLVPSRKGATIGFFDLVSRTFKTASTGTLLAGLDTTLGPTPDAPMDIVCNNGVLKARHQSGLPLGYQKLNGVAFDGSSYIDTELTSFSNDGVYECDFVTSTLSTMFLFGQNPSATSSQVGFFTSTSLVWQYGASSRLTASNTANTAYNIVTENGKLTVNGTATTGTASESIIINQHLFVGAGVTPSANPGTNTPDSRMFVGTIKRFKYTLDGTVMCDLVPVKRLSDNAIGFYDMARDRFFANAGTGTFTAGSPVSDPVEIYTDGTVETIRVSGNLVDFNETRINGTTWASADKTKGFEVEAAVYAKNVGNSVIGNPNCFGVFVPCSQGKSVSINFFDYTVYGARCFCCEVDADGEATTAPVQYATNQNVLTQQTFTITQPDSIGFVIEWYITSAQERNYTKENYTVVAGTTPPTQYIPFNICTATCEDLLSIGTYTDEQEVISGAVTRKVGIKVLDGTENWTRATNQDGSANYVFYTQIDDKKVGNNQPMLCSHHEYIGSGSYVTLTAGKFLSNANNTSVYFDGGSITTATNWKNWLATQYANGTPVIIIYPLPTATTESVAGQTLQVTGGDNTLTITQAGLTGLELEAEYQAAVSLTIQEVEDANLDNNVEVTIS